MSTDRANDLRAFRSFIDEQLAQSGEEITLQDALAHWAFANQSDQQRQETLEAIERGFADIDAGRLTPAREALHALRRKHNRLASIAESMNPHQ